MFRVTTKKRFTIKISSELVGEHLELWLKANNTDLTIDKHKHVKAHMICEINDSKPFQYLMLQGGDYYGRGVYRATSFYIEPDMRDKLSYADHIELWDNLSMAVEAQLTDCKAIIVTNERFDKLLKKINFKKDTNYRYLVDEPKSNKNNWKYVYCRGSMSALKLPKISIAQYEAYFE